MRFFKKIGKTLLVLLLCSCLLLLYAFKIEPFLLFSHSYTLSAPGVQAAETITLVQISDIQISEAYPEENLKKLVKKVNAASPDIIVFTGDLYDNYARYHANTSVKEALSDMIAPYGKFAIWGNRDYGGGASRVYSELMESSGFTLLENSSTSITFQNDKTLLIGGLDDALLGAADVEAIKLAMDAPADYRILLLHEPDILNRLEYDTANLALAGHSHGGQVRLPFFQGIRTSLAKEYTRGFYDIGSMKLYVNTGLGTSHIPIRFMVPPEIAIFHISF